MTAWLIHQWPSSLLGAWTLFASWVLGNKKRSGWMLGIVGEVLWIGYAIWFHQVGFFISAFPFAIVYWRNWIKWKPEVANAG